VAAFVANVGVNSGHAARSPLFGSGEFRLLPIPERHRWRPPMLRLQDLPELTSFAPRSWHGRAVHLDPDFTSDVPSYGDNCRRAGRAFSLRRATPGDVVVFLARLHPEAAPAGFHLVGCLVIDDVLADVARDPGAGWWDGNAHVRRARAAGEWDSFWVFKGAPGSRLFARAVKFARREAELVFGDWRWMPGRTELQTIGSYTRAVRRVEGRGEEWLRTICRS
jgi:putative DNA base modification enzyme with NMAD domain